MKISKWNSKLFSIKIEFKGIFNAIGFQGNMLDCKQINSQSNLSNSY